MPERNYEKQNKKRRAADDRYVNEAFDALSKAVYGKQKKDSFDTQYDIRTAIGQIAGFFGKKAEILEDEAEFEVQLDYAMNPLGIMRRNIVLDDNWYRDCIFPMIVTEKETGDLVALIPSRDRYYYTDSENGTKIYISRKNCNRFDDAAVCFYKPFPEKKISFKELLGFSLSFITMWDIAVIVLLLLAAALAGLWIPPLTRILFDYIVPGGNISLLVSIIFFLAMAALCRLLLNYLKGVFEARVVQKITFNVNAAAMIKIYSLPVSFFSDYTSGELVKRVSCIDTACRQCLTIVFDSVLTALFSLIYFFQISALAPELAPVALIIILVSVCCNCITAFITMNRMRSAMETDARENGVAYSMISGIQKIRVSGAEKRVFARWATLMAQVAAVKYRPVFVNAIAVGVAAAGNIILYNIAAGNSMTPADYYAFTAAYGNVTAAFMSLASVGVAVAQIKPAFEMAGPILNAESESSGSRNPVTVLKGNIEINNVSFKYGDNQTNVLSQLSLNISSGQYVAIVGRTGCGKSTLVRLMLGFESPQTGTIAYDGNAVDSVDVKSLRSRIGTVLQNGSLFQGSVLSNIIVGQPSLTADDAWKAAEIANIADDIRKMPMGMETLLTEGDGCVSGGQKQRILIARAVVSKPEILIFDEATSALDNISQKKITDSLEQLDCTRIVIAHRLSTVRNCDRILVLDGGRIAEDGTYEDLISLNGIFADLVRKQRLDI